MISAEKREIIKYRLSRAEETLKEANILLSANALAGAVNRAYYAMFYAVLALLTIKGLSSSKHAGVRSLFDREFVKSGVVDKQWSKFYRQMFEDRQEGDYHDFVVFDVEDVIKRIHRAGEFITEIKRVIESMGVNLTREEL